MATRSKIAIVLLAGSVLLGPGQLTSSAQDGVDIDGAVAAADPALGQTVSFQCIGCHSFGEGEAARVGPNLFGIVGRLVGGVEGFAFSEPMAALGAGGDTWTPTMLNDFLTSPAGAIPGTSMGYGGLGNDVDRYNLIAYLASLTAAD